MARTELRIGSDRTSQLSNSPRLPVLMGGLEDPSVSSLSVVEFSYSKSGRAVAFSTANHGSPKRHTRVTHEQCMLDCWRHTLHQDVQHMSNYSDQ